MNGTKARRIAAVERYVHDLAIALADIPADEREDVIAGIREHIDDSLAGIDDPTPVEVEQVLTSLGEPVEIAADARGRSGPASSPQPQASRPVAPAASTAGQSVPLLTREWVPIGVMGMFILAAFATWFAGPGSGFGVLVWLGGLVALVAAPLWTTVEKVVGTLWFGGLPVVAGAVGVMLGVGPFGAVRPVIFDGRGLPIGGPVRDSFGYGDVGWLAAAGFGLIGLVGTVVIMAWLVTTGTRRAQGLTP